MASYHINPQTGNAGLCHAQYQCPFGGEDRHYSTKEEARSTYEQEMEMAKQEQSLLRFESRGISRLLRSSARDWANSLSKAEKEAVSHRRMDGDNWRNPRSWTQKAHNENRQAGRSLDSHSPQTEALVDGTLRSIMTRFSLPHDTLAHRGISIASWGDLGVTDPSELPGMTIDRGGITSFTLDPGVAKSFAVDVGLDRANHNYNIIFHVTFPQGTHAIPSWTVPGEYQSMKELMVEGQHLRITKVLSHQTRSQRGEIVDVTHLICESTDH